MQQLQVYDVLSEEEKEMLRKQLEEIRTKQLSNER